MVSFEPFRDWFWSNHPTKRKSHICKEADISWATVNKIFNDQTVQIDIVGKICKAYQLKIEQVMQYIEVEESS